MTRRPDTLKRPARTAAQRINSAVYWIALAGSTATTMLASHSLAQLGCFVVVSTLGFMGGQAAIRADES